MEIMLVAAQPYPGESSTWTPEKATQKRFHVFPSSKTQYTIVDNEFEDDITIDSVLLHEADFMPTLWYAQSRSLEHGLDPDAPHQVKRYLEEIGDAQAECVGLLIAFNVIGNNPGDVPEERFEINPGKDKILISDTELGTCVSLPRELLQDPRFDLFAWYEREVSLFEAELALHKFVNLSDWDSESMPSLRTVSDTESERGSMPDLQSVSNSDYDESCSGDSVPSLELRPVDDSSDEESDVEESARLVMPGDPEETFEDRMKLWALASEDLPPPSLRPDLSPRSHRLGDVLGNTVAALLEFFQPYPGDERVPWSDERRESARRFRALRPSGDFYVIEDSFFDSVTTLSLEELRCPAFYLVEWNFWQMPFSNISEM
ncbi:hypothetical protein C8R45DRAFT_936952 [Mycena sanguinolenta]|nr:hypothetical protein C8R45DRAFT_936952 [Mycena sanguinolenta]